MLAPVAAVRIARLLELTTRDLRCGPHYVIDLAVRVVGLRLWSETAMATSEASWLLAH